MSFKDGSFARLLSSEMNTNHVCVLSAEQDPAAGPSLRARRTNKQCCSSLALTSNLNVLKIKLKWDFL